MTPQQLAIAPGNLAEIYAQGRQQQQAVNLTQQALYQAQAVNAREIAYLWQWQLGRLFKNQGDIDRAIAAYTEAVQNFFTEFANGSPS